MKAKSLNCSNCGGPIEVKNGFKAKMAACPNCDSLLDLSTPKYEVLGTLEPGRNAPTGYICLGMKGTFDDEAFEVIGRLRLKGSEWDSEDGWEYFHWDEWLLLTENGRYMWLEEDEGKYTLHKVFTPEQPVPRDELTGRVLVVDGASLRVHDRGEGEVSFIEGELTWRARLGDTVNYVDAGYGKKRVAIEWSEDEIEYFHSEHWSKHELFEHFGMDEHLAIIGEQEAASTASRSAIGRVFVSVGIVVVGAGLAFCMSCGEIMMNPIIDSKNAVHLPSELLTTTEGIELGSFDLDPSANGYSLTADVVFIPPVNNVTLTLVEPDGDKRDMINYGMVGKGWGEAFGTTSFSVTEKGQYRLIATGLATGAPADPAPAGYYNVTTTKTVTQIDWRIYEGRFAVGVPMCGSMILGGSAIPLFFLGLFVWGARHGFGGEDHDAKLRQATRKVHMAARGLEGAD